MSNCHQEEYGTAIRNPATRMDAEPEVQDRRDLVQVTLT